MDFTKRMMDTLISLGVDIDIMPDRNATRMVATFRNRHRGYPPIVVEAYDLELCLSRLLCKLIERSFGERP